MYNFNKLGIAIDNTETDDHIYKACKQLDGDLFNIEEIHIVHAKNFNFLEKQSINENNELFELEAAFEKSLYQDILENATKHFGDAYVGKIHVHILKGTPGDEVVAFQAEHSMDIFIAGKKKDKNKSGRFAKDLIRRLDIPVMLFPEEINENWKLKDILVPYDYSDYSDKALLAALELKKVKPVERIECFHLINSPAFSGGALMSSQKIVRYMVEDRKMEFQVKMNDLGIKDHPDLELKLYDKFAGSEIKKRAYTGGFSLIIMGAKGHSTIERFFLGSVTEKVISLNDKLPLLIVR